MYLDPTAPNYARQQMEGNMIQCSTPQLQARFNGLSKEVKMR